MRAGLRPLALTVIPAFAIAIGLPAGTVSAAPTCDGHPATIVGTNGNDTIGGTSGPDVIAGRGGRDTIDGRGGRDRICGGGAGDTIDGGGGNDRIFGGGGNDVATGGRGNDDLFGFTGEDRLKGGRARDLLVGGEADDFLLGGGGPDRLFGNDGGDGLDGGPASDDCDERPGVDVVVNCEEADLAVDVDAPANANKGPVRFTAEVTNNGPDGTTYTLAVNERDSGGTGGCEVANEEVPIPQPFLGAGQQRTHEFTLDCPVEPGAGGSNEVSAVADADATDANPGNDESSSVIVWN